MFHFHKVLAKPRASSQFISVKSIVRGALLVQDYESQEFHLVVDVVDGDMWLCVKEMRATET
jgi:hypothetical protein